MLLAMEMRDSVRNVINIQLNDGSNDELATAQKNLNDTYDKYVKICEVIIVSIEKCRLEQKINNFLEFKRRINFQCRQIIDRRPNLLNNFLTFCQYVC